MGRGELRRASSYMLRTCAYIAARRARRVQIGGSSAPVAWSARTVQRWACGLHSPVCCG